MSARQQQHHVVIYAPCEWCGEVRLVVSEVTLSFCVNAPQHSTYAFTCPCCHERMERPLDVERALALKRNGVETHEWSLPDEALEPHRGEPLTTDDVLDFTLRLSRVDTVAALLD